MATLATQVLTAKQFLPSIREKNDFEFLDFPGAVLTNAWGVNSAGQIVGTYNNADGSVHGFLAQRSTK